MYGADGKFHHFARQCDPIHLKNGYWRFSTCDDNQRAHLHGFTNPEQVLKAQDAGDGEYNDIVLLWVPGELDTNNKTSVGTAAVHLQTIYNERKLLGKTLSFRGAVPLYPVSTDPQLLQYRLTRYGIQKGKLPNDLLSSSSISTGMRLMQPMLPAPSPSTTSTLIGDSTRVEGHISQAKIILAPTSLAPPIQSKPVQSSASTSAPAVPSFGQIPLRSSALVAAASAIQTVTPFDSRACFQTSLPIQRQDRVDLPLDSPDSNMNVESALAEDMIEVLETEEFFLVNDDGGCHISDDHRAFDKDAVDTDGTLSLAALTPEDLFHAQAASLPCIDCGLIGSHTSGCWINQLAPIKGTGDLTPSELKKLVNQVTKFDPVSWTTHYGPPEQVEEDSETLLRSMADVVRNLDQTAKDPDLQGLNDQLTVLFDALKSIGEVQILGEHQEL